MQEFSIAHYDRQNNIVSRYVNCPNHWRDSVKPYLEESFTESYINPLSQEKDGMKIDFEYLVRVKGDETSIKRFPYFGKKDLQPLFVWNSLKEKWMENRGTDLNNFHNKVLDLMRQRVFFGCHKEIMDTLYLYGLYRKPVY
jgi:hypothetical protein